MVRTNEIARPSRASGCTPPNGNKRLENCAEDVKRRHRRFEYNDHLRKLRLLYLDEKIAQSEYVQAGTGYTLGTDIASFNTYPRDLNPRQRPRALTPPREGRRRLRPGYLQHRSQLLRLPKEIRLMIWEFLLSGLRIHLVPKFQKLGHVICYGDRMPYGCLHEGDIAGPLKADTVLSDWNLTYLLRTCSLIYSEIIHMVYALPTFSAPSDHVLDLLQATILPSRFKTIRHLSLQVTELAPAPYDVFRHVLNLDRLQSFDLILHGLRPSRDESSLLKRIEKKISLLRHWAPPASRSRNAGWTLRVFVSRRGITEAPGPAPIIIEKGLRAHGFSVSVLSPDDFPGAPPEHLIASVQKPPRVNRPTGPGPILGRHPLIP